MGRGKSRVIVTELPYQTNKSALIERIADLARDGTLEGLADLRDESDRQGMRIVIELKSTADPDTVIRELYKRTPMQGTFSIINLALVIYLFLTCAASFIKLRMASQKFIWTWLQ